MRGIVTIELNERLRPGINAPISGFYSVGNIVNVVDSVLGDSYDSDDLWYKLSNGSYVWSGGVDVSADCSALPLEDRDHYLISYRKINPDGRPNLDTKEPPDTLYFAPLRLPADSESIRVNPLPASVFASTVVQAVSKLAPQRKHVFIYIHGYQLFSSLKLDLLSSFVLNYMTHPDNTIAKVLFMAWPGQGGPSRKTVDDRSIRAGQQFTSHNLFRYFETLSEALKKEGRTLNLIVHSFGHQLLNGMLNPGEEHEAKIPSSKIFENIFLMAPDVTHLTVKKEGTTLRNYFKDKEGADYHYDFSRLNQIGKQVHVFHDKYDYLLYSSTKKFVEKGDLKKVKTPTERFAITANYRNLGNYGADKLAPDLPLVPPFHFHDIEELIAKGEMGDLIDYPFRIIRDRPRNDVDAVWKDANYDGINAGRIIFNAKRFPDHHRYLYTCKPVINKLLDLLI